MKKACGACRGERGCIGCNAVGMSAEYFGLTDFYKKNSVRKGLAFEEEKQCSESRERLSDKEIFLAADLGTTTLAFVCADEQGTVLAAYGCENPQRRIAADVIGRIDAALHGQGEFLTNEIREALIKGFLFVLSRGMEEEYSKAVAEDWPKIRIAIAGNTTMQHLLLGYPLDSMAKVPFVPHTLKETRSLFGDLFFDTYGYGEVPRALKSAEVTVFPCLSAFVGGDVVSGANALFVKDEQRNELLIDLGTNGEILLSAKGAWYGTAAAMGSAFEGGRYAYASDLFHRIGNALESGILDETGLLCEPYFSEGYEGLLQEDVREFQLAKGAIRAGIELLCKYAGVSLEKIERVYIAGGLGRYCDSEDFFQTGLLPRKFEGKTEEVGNSCIGGLLHYLKNKESVLYCRGEILNLAEQPEFEELYYRFMNFETEE